MLRVRSPSTVLDPRRSRTTTTRSASQLRRNAAHHRCTRAGTGPLRQNGSCGGRSGSLARQMVSMIRLGRTRLRNGTSQAPTVQPGRMAAAPSPALPAVASAWSGLMPPMPASWSPGRPPAGRAGRHCPQTPGPRLPDSAPAGRWWSAPSPGCPTPLYRPRLRTAPRPPGHGHLGDDYHDDHLAARVAPFQIPERQGGLNQWVRSVDDGSELAGLDQLAHGPQVLLIHLRIQPTQLLTHEPGQQGRPQDPAEEAPGPWPTAVASDDHEGPLAGEGAAKL